MTDLGHLDLSEKTWWSLFDYHDSLAAEHRAAADRARSFARMYQVKAAAARMGDDELVRYCRCGEKMRQTPPVWTCPSCGDTRFA